MGTKKGGGLSARPACAVELCASLRTARRVTCCIHAAARAFTVADRIWAPSLGEAPPGGRPDAPEELLCVRCATNRIRTGQATTLRVVDAQRIHERNREARTAPERAACARCGRFIVGATPRLVAGGSSKHTQAALSLTPPVRR